MDTSADTLGRSTLELLRAEPTAASMPVGEKLLLVGGLTIALVIGWSLLSWVQRWSRLKLLEAQWVPAIRFRKAELVGSRGVRGLLASGLGLVFQTAKLLGAYVCLTVGLRQFEATQPWSEKLLHFLLDPAVQLGAALVVALPNLLAMAVIGFIFHQVIRLSNFLFRQVEQGKLVIGGFFPEWAYPTRQIVRLLLVVFAVVLMYPYSPLSESKAAQGISLFLAVVLSLSSTAAIGNMTSGLLLTYARAFQLGDYVRIGTAEGTVVEKTLLMTRVRTVKNEEISVPNSSILTGTVINYSEAQRRGEAVVLYTSVTIGYDVPWRQVHALLLEAAAATPGLETVPAPFVLQRQLTDYYPTYELNAYTKTPEQMVFLYGALHANIQDAFNRAGVEILSPAYQVSRVSLETTVPVAHRSGDYRIPGVRVEVRRPDA